MAHLIQQRNYLKEPTAEQRKVFVEAFGLRATDIPSTRIDAHLRIRELLGYGLDASADARAHEECNERRNKLKQWQRARKQKRLAKRVALAEAGLIPASNGR
jgi:hypothetical protein